MTIPVEQLQKLDNITIIELFELQLVSGLHYSATDSSATGSSNTGDRKSIVINQ